MSTIFIVLALIFASGMVFAIPFMALVAKANKMTMREYYREMCKNKKLLIISASGISSAVTWFITTMHGILT